MHVINKQGIDLIKKYESFKSEPYICPAGKKTIGYGHVIKSGEKFESLTQIEAERLLDIDLDYYESKVREIITDPINQNQFSALVSLCYNIGEDNFKKSSLAKFVNNNDDLNAVLEFIKWSFVSRVRFKGLIRRRLEEALLFLSD